MRIFVALLVALFAGSLAGCNRGPSPEEVARSFYELSDLGLRQGSYLVQEELFALLDQSSQERFQECAQQMSKGLDGEAGIGFAPSSCLVVAGFSGDRREFEAQRVFEGEKRVRLKITSQTEARLLELVRQDGWKIDLQASAELNQQDPP